MKNTWNIHGRNASGAVSQLGQSRAGETMEQQSEMPLVGGFNDDEDEFECENGEDPNNERDPHGNSMCDAQSSSSSSAIMAAGGDEDEDIEALGLRDCIEEGGKEWGKDEFNGDRDVIRFRGDDDCIYPQNHYQQNALRNLPSDLKNQLIDENALNQGLPNQIPLTKRPLSSLMMSPIISQAPNSQLVLTKPKDVEKKTGNPPPTSCIPKSLTLTSQV